MAPIVKTLALKVKHISTENFLVVLRVSSPEDDRNHHVVNRKTLAHGSSQIDEIAVRHGKRFRARLSGDNDPGYKDSIGDHREYAIAK